MTAQERLRTKLMGGLWTAALCLIGGYAATESRTVDSDAVLVYANAYWKPAVDRALTELADLPEVTLIAPSSVRTRICQRAQAHPAGGRLQAVLRACKLSTSMAATSPANLQDSVSHLRGTLQSVRPAQVAFLLPRSADPQQDITLLTELRRELTRDYPEVRLSYLAPSDTRGNPLGLFTLPHVHLSFPAEIDLDMTQFSGSIAVSSGLEDLRLDIASYDATGSGLRPAELLISGGELKVNSSATKSYRMLGVESLLATGQFESPTRGYSRVVLARISSASSGDTLSIAQATVRRESPKLAVLVAGDQADPSTIHLGKFLRNLGITPKELVHPLASVRTCDGFPKEVAEWKVLLIAGWMDQEYGEALQACFGTMEASGSTLPQLIFLSVPRDPAQTAVRDIPPGWNLFLSPFAPAHASPRKIAVVMDGSASMDEPACGTGSPARNVIAETVGRTLARDLIARESVVQFICRTGCGSDPVEQAFAVPGKSLWEGSDHIARIYQASQPGGSLENVSDVVAFWMPRDVWGEQGQGKSEWLFPAAVEQVESMLDRDVRFWVFAMDPNTLVTQSSRLNGSLRFQVNCAAVSDSARVIGQTLFRETLPRVQLTAGPALNNVAEPVRVRIEAALANPKLRFNSAVLAPDSDPSRAAFTVVSALHWSGKVDKPQNRIFMVGLSGGSPSLPTAYLALDLEGEVAESALTDYAQQSAIAEFVLAALSSLSPPTGLQLTAQITGSGSVTLRRHDRKPFQLVAPTGVSAIEASASGSDGRPLGAGRPVLDDLQQIEVDFEAARQTQVPYMATVRLTDASLGTVAMNLPVARFEAVLAPPEVLGAIGEPFGTGVEPVVTARAHASPPLAIAPVVRTILGLALAVILTVLLLLS